MAGSHMAVLAASGGGGIITLSAASLFSSGGVQCSLFFNTDGTLEYVQDGGSSFPTGEWLNPPTSGGAALYEVQRTQVSGTLGVSFTGTFTSSVWYPLNVRRGVTVIATGSTRTNISTYAIRRASDSVVLVTGIQIDLTGDI